MLVSIIICARDEDPPVLDATLAGLYRTTGHLPTEVIVVDDASRTPVICGRWQARLLRNPVPLGTCGSRRIGALISIGDVLVWLDAHMSFGENWLDRMLAHSDSDTLICSPFCSYHHREPMGWGADFTWTASRDYAQNQYPCIGMKHRTSPPGMPFVEVPMISGACYMMRRAAYERLGGFSPYYRVWGPEEQDLSARSWLAGMKVACAAEARVGHLSRPAFPYPVRFEDLEFNQVVMLRCLFERATVERLEPRFRPLPAIVERWLAEADLHAWRAAIQSRRTMSDQSFFDRFIPELAGSTETPEKPDSQECIRIPPVDDGLGGGA